MVNNTIDQIQNQLALLRAMVDRVEWACRLTVGPKRGGDPPRDRPFMGWWGVGIFAAQWCDGAYWKSAWGGDIISVNPPDAWAEIREEKP